MSALPYSPWHDWHIEYENGVAARMYWLGVRYGPPKPDHIEIEPCHTHDRLTFGCNNCRRWAHQARPVMKPTGYRYELCLNAAGKWYWRRTSRNGEIQFVAQAYHSKSNARRAIRRLDPNATITTIHG